MPREEENSEWIPFDLVNEVLLRLPSKSVARFRCVSKLWGSTLDNPNFPKSFFIISSSRPKLMFTCLKGGKTFFFSSPQPRKSSPLAANFQMSFPSNRPWHICRPVRGLVCGLNQQRYRTADVPLICNPSTGQFFTLPRVNKRRAVSKNCLGYDPVDKQFKLLCITVPYRRLAYSQKYHVLTLETASWRMIECDIPHYPSAVDSRNCYYVYDEICINGVCYYFARLHSDEKFPVIVFDIRYEKFKSITIAQGMRHNLGKKFDTTLANYKGMLAKLQLNIVGGICIGIQLWVMEDAEIHEWSSYIYVLPPPWNNIVDENNFRFVGMNTSTGEIVLSPKTISDSFYLFYYSPERNIITRVEVQGLEAFKHCAAYTFLDHVEDVNKLRQVSRIRGS